MKTIEENDWIIDSLVLDKKGLVSYIADMHSDLQSELSCKYPHSGIVSGLLEAIAACNTRLDREVS